MKKYLMTMLALVFGLGLVQANPVGVSQAKYVGQQFVQANFEQSRQAQDLTLVYTGTSTRGEACFYVFNVGNDGFVMVSADDFYRPIIGYSKNRSFDTNINPELGYMLNQLIASRTGKNTGKATPKVAAEWQSVMNSGKLISRNGGRGEFYLVQTQWDQGSPYNYFCPQAAGGPGGRVYAGCVATAMSQVMKYWNHPLQGTGSHTNYNSGFGPLSADFGATTYEWDKMPNKLTNNSPQEEIEAIALLMYHCGIAVDMHYAIDGSGAYSQDVPSRITQYFGYTNQAVLRGRDNYTYDNWSQMLKESFDMGWPLYYSGQSPEGGHAFVCDGYN
ncbi:MAG: C10 family peptidase, partial [Bacteroidales bacterium]|nr:C10 family peptidase [Bacteroidales bacterium]